MHKEIFHTKKDIKNTKIAFLSDLHYYNDFPIKTLNRLHKQIIKSNPNYIIFTGDTIDTSSVDNFTNLETFLKNISKIAPVIVILGNHEIKSRNENNYWEEKINPNIEKVFKNINNVYLLEDTNYLSNNINFYGFNMSFNYYEETKENYDIFCEEINNKNPKFNNKNYNILLIHSPSNIYKYLNNNKESNLNKSDLILSGHMHNSLLPFPITNIINKTFKTNHGIIAPSDNFFPKYSYGRIYKKDGYIHPGITKLAKSSRYFKFLDIFFRKNIIIIEIKKDD